MKSTIVIALLLLGFCLSYRTSHKISGFLKNDYEPLTYDNDVIDNSTYANVKDVTTQHLHLDWIIDFDQRIVFGNITHTMKVLNSKFKEVILDSRYLNISYVMLNDSGKDKMLEFYFTEENPNIGQALHIKLDSSMVKGSTFDLKINYATTNESSALVWLDPVKTDGKSFPYVYSHCEAINCRSLLPVQDTPSVRATYSAYVKSFANMTVRMSGNTTNETDSDDYKYKYTTIKMNSPVPSYLISLVVGHISLSFFDDRSGAYGEDVVMWKINEVLTIMKDAVYVAETFLPKLQWDYFLMIDMPSSYSLEDTGNPLLSSISPTIVVIDGNSTYQAFHTLAHYWAGALVTHKNWENYWLNEGFTVFIERKISKRFYGEAFAKVQAALGNSTLYKDMQKLGFNSTLTSLHPKYEGIDPLEASLSVPKEKGFQFLAFIETLIGEENIEKFLYKYFDTFKFQSIVYTDFWNLFEKFLSETYSKSEANKIKAQIDLDAWIFGTGMPPVQLNFSTFEMEDAKNLAMEYIELGGKSSPDNYTRFFGYFSHQKCVFAQTLLDNLDQVTTRLVAKVDSDYGLYQNIDPEFKTIWFQTLIYLEYRIGWAYATQFMTSMARLKYLIPLYTAFKEVDPKTAANILRAGSIYYDKIATEKIKELLEID